MIPFTLLKPHPGLDFFYFLLLKSYLSILSTNVRSSMQNLTLDPTQESLQVVVMLHYLSASGPLIGGAKAR